MANHRTQQVIEAYVGKPGLVREASRVSCLTEGFGITKRVVLDMVEMLKWRVKVGLLGSAREHERAGRRHRPMSARDEATHAFHDVVLPPELKQQVICDHKESTKSHRPRTWLVRKHSALLLFVILIVRYDTRQRHREDRGRLSS